MIQANISKKNNQQTITAVGDVPELMNDLAIIVNGIYGQLQTASPSAAAQFRFALIGMLSAIDSPVWKPMGNQTGITFRMPDTEEDGHDNV